MNSFEEQSNDYENCRYLKENNFIFGICSSDLQNEGGRSYRDDSIWDDFCRVPRNIKDGSNMDVTCDFYHRYKEDIQLMRKLGYKHFRLSISWPRVMKNGREANEEGIQFYIDVFNELITNSIEPHVTLYHWNLPSYLYREYRGWLDRRIIKDFVNFAKLCFKRFPMITTWITFNEIWVAAVNGHCTGIQAPGLRESPGEDPYIVAHNMLLAHGYSVKHYRKNYHGKIGMTANTNWWQSITNYPQDIEAAQRGITFMFDWIYEPLKTGNYPQLMIDIVGDRLPKFTEKEKNMLIGSVDFIGVNYYTSLVCGQTTFIRFIANVYRFLGMRDFFSIMFNNHYYSDMNVMVFKPIGETTQMGWEIDSNGLYKVIKYIHQNYPTEGGIHIYENGIATDDDSKRIKYISDHLKEIVRAKKDGFDVRSYFYWCFMSNMEWQEGYTVDFGLVNCDFETLDRSVKPSAIWYGKYANGEINEIDEMDETEEE